MSVTLAIGTRLGGYRVEGPLGRGGMGLVFLAEHERLGRKAALKLLIPELAKDADFRERFVRESQLIAAIEHPNIIPIYDAGETEELLYVAMRYVEGHDLKTLLAREGPLAVERALEIVGDAGAALDAAHARELIHRDVKPANILLDTPSARTFLTDFGIAKERTSSATQPGLFVGTVGYTPPEQIEGRPISPATDVYALGCVLYESLTGLPAFEKETDVAMIYAHLSDPPPAVTAKRADLPAALDVVIASALAKSEAERYQTCGELLAAARSALGGSTVVVPTPGVASAPLLPPSSAPAQAVRASLPTPDTPLVGRASERDEACAVLRGNVRLLTFTGPGGTGKTRLAIEVGRALSSDFPDGVAFVNLAAVNDPALVTTAVAEALGVEERAEGGADDLHAVALDALRVRLRDARLLLVVDNFEHVLPAAPIVAELLAAAPFLKALVTSRASLRLSQEREYPVLPLALPDPGSAEDLEAVAASPAVALFVDRAQSVRPSFALDAESAPAVVEICIRLDGLPLAIELAAARVKLLSPQAILTKLESRLELLTGGARDLPSRHQTLRGTIDWSYDLLGAEAQLLLARLAVFSGFTIEAAEEICATPGELDSGTIVDALSSLVDENLVRRRETADGDVRFELLETIHEYAMFRLVERREVDDFRVRHVAYYAELAESAAPGMVAAGQAASVKRLAEETGNLRAAMAWSLDAGELEFGLRIAASLARYWSIRGEMTEGRRWLDQALPRADEVAPPVRAKALFAAGYTALGQGDYTDSLAHFEESLALHRELGDRVGSADCLVQIGWLLITRGELERATSVSQEGLALAEGLGEARTASLALATLGDAAFAEGNYDRASELYGESLDLRRQVGDRRIIADALLKSGRADLLRGDPTHAVNALEEGLRLARELDDGWTTSVALVSLGSVRLAEGDQAGTRSLLAEALVICRRRGDKRLAAECLIATAALAASFADPVRAARLCGAAEGLRATTGATPSPLERLLEWGHLSPILEDESLRTHWEEGRVLDLDQAVAFALEPLSVVEAVEPPRSDRTVTSPASKPRP
jgi:non-specific serine/threonine protein kinase